MSVSRRDFIGTSAGVLGASVLTPSLIARPSGLLPLPEQDPSIRELAMLALDAARSAGASYADVRISRTRTQSVCTPQDRVGHQCDTGADQLGTGGVDEDWIARRPMEGDLVIRPALFPVLELRLGDSRLEVDIPEDRCVAGVGLATRQVLEESPL